ncbi:AraC family transcriptional regulator [Umezawaea beigongshangensis]|uniref:AraC family transcriptional regulator n=1 Tax=Umezawaea beigongshangensis TaxID=2780383 RepID=UPI0018F25D9F|nr:AraC family transcriptional regulator [Umezawaea beigongshangensis]
MMVAVDVLADVLQVYGARSSLGVRIEAGGVWGVWLQTYPGAALHLVTEGELWLQVPGEPSLRVGGGDAVLVPPGTPHGLAGVPGARTGPCDRIAATAAEKTGTAMRLGTGPVRTRVLTVHHEQDSESSIPLFPALSRPVRVVAEQQPRLVATAQLLSAELAAPQFGTTAAVNSLVDLVLVQFARAQLAGRPAERSASWLDALRDPVVRDALTRIHHEPGRAWTTASLAAALHVSRATLSRRFAAVLGQSPGAYLTRLRMDLGAIRLRDTGDPVESIAAAVGYASPKAFSRAFQRARAQSPSEYRYRVRADALAARAS